jgi:hypothetical protein
MNVLKYYKDFIDSRIVMRGHTNTLLLLAGMLIAVLVTSIIGSLSNRIVYAHTFSASENALLLLYTK